MNYKKIIKDNYNIHIIDSDRFKSTVVQIIFAKVFDKNDISYNKLLKSILVYNTKKYNTKSKMIKKIEDLYGMNIAGGYSIVGNLEILDFSLEFLNPKFTDEKTRDESIEMFMEILLNPNVKDNAFSSDVLEVLKNAAKNECENIINNPKLFSSREYAKLMYKGTPSEYSVYSTIENLEKVDAKSIYEYYKKLFDGTYKIDIMIHGSGSKILAPLIEKKLKNVKCNNEGLNIFSSKKDDSRLIEKEDVMNFSQSKLYLGYKINGYDDKIDYYSLRVLNVILGAMNNSILFDTVREKNSLCYNISSYINRYNPSLTIYSGINKSNKDKTITLIKECVSSLKNKVLVDNLLDAARKNIETSLNSYYDDLVGQIHNYYMNEFSSVLEIEEYRKKLFNVSSDDIIKVAKKLSLKVVYFMKGDLE